MDRKQWHQRWFPDWARFAASVLAAASLAAWRIAIAYDDLQNRLANLEKQHAMVLQTQTLTLEKIDKLEEQNTVILVVLHEKWPRDLPLPQIQSNHSDSSAVDPPQKTAAKTKVSK